jgi:hypothetical protein
MIKKAVSFVIIMMMVFSSSLSFAEDTLPASTGSKAANIMPYLVAADITFAGLQFVKLPAQWTLSPGLSAAAKIEGGLVAIPLILGLVVAATKEKKENPYFNAKATFKYEGYNTEDREKIKEYIKKTIAEYEGEKLTAVMYASKKDENGNMKALSTRYVKESEADVPDRQRDLENTTEFFGFGNRSQGFCEITVSAVHTLSVKSGIFSDTKSRRVNLAVSALKNNPACSQEAVERGLVTLAEKFKAIPLGAGSAPNNQTALNTQH